MKSFEEKYFNYKIILESPEIFEVEETGDVLTSESSDVIAFIYQLSTGALSFSKKGIRTPHFEILNHIRGKKKSNHINIKGNFDMDMLYEFDVVTGRMWVDHDKISFWLPPENKLPELEDTGLLRYIVEQIGDLLNIDMNDYEIELSEVLGSSKQRISF